MPGQVDPMAPLRAEVARATGVGTRHASHMSRPQPLPVLLCHLRVIRMAIGTLD
jgi:hypothetical protein